MEQKICEEDRQLDFNCKTILPGVEKSTAAPPAHVQKPGIVANQNLELKIACQTPEKTNEPLHTKFKDGDVNLPDKWVAQWMHLFIYLLFFFFFFYSKIGHLSSTFRFRIISEFFDGMNCSFRLLSLCKRFACLNFMFCFGYGRYHFFLVPSSLVGFHFQPFQCWVVHHGIFLQENGREVNDLDSRKMIRVLFISCRLCILVQARIFYYAWIS